MDSLQRLAPLPGAAAVAPRGTVIPDAAAELLRTVAAALGHEL